MNGLVSSIVAIIYNNSYVPNISITNSWILQVSMATSLGRGLGIIMFLLILAPISRSVDHTCAFLSIIYIPTISAWTFF